MGRRPKASPQARLVPVEQRPLHHQISDLMVDAGDPAVSDACCVILKYLSVRHACAEPDYPMLFAELRVPRVDGGPE